MNSCCGTSSEYEVCLYLYLLSMIFRHCSTERLGPYLVSISKELIYILKVNWGTRSQPESDLESRASKPSFVNIAYNEDNIKRWKTNSLQMIFQTLSSHYPWIFLEHVEWCQSIITSGECSVVTLLNFVNKLHCANGNSFLRILSRAFIFLHFPGFKTVNLTTKIDDELASKLTDGQYLFNSKASDIMSKKYAKHSILQAIRDVFYPIQLQQSGRSKALQEIFNSMTKKKACKPSESLLVKLAFEHDDITLHDDAVRIYKFIFELWMMDCRGIHSYKSNRIVFHIRYLIRSILSSLS